MLLHLVQWAVVFFWQIFLCYSPKIQFWWYHNTHHLQVLVAPGEVSFKEQMSCYIHDLTTVWESIFHCHKNQEIFHFGDFIHYPAHVLYFRTYWIINVLELVNQFQQKLRYISPIYFEILALALDVNIHIHVPVAQLVEHHVVMQEVVSSTPARPTLRVLK